MRGGRLHNEVILAAIRSDLIGLGARVYEEHPVPLDGTTCSVDLLAEFPVGVRLVVEAELTSRRVRRDLAKAHALQADALLIVTHSPAAARRCASAVRRETTRFDGEVFVRPLGPARAAMARWFSLISGDDLCG